MRMPRALNVIFVFACVYLLCDEPFTITHRRHISPTSVLRAFALAFRLNVSLLLSRKIPTDNLPIKEKKRLKFAYEVRFEYVPLYTWVIVCVVCMLSWRSVSSLAICLVFHTGAFDIFLLFMLLFFFVPLHTVRERSQTVYCLFITCSAISWMAKSFFIRAVCWEATAHSLSCFRRLLRQRRQRQRRRSCTVSAEKVSPCFFPLPFSLLSPLSMR